MGQYLEYEVRSHGQKIRIVGNACSNHRDNGGTIAKFPLTGVKINLEAPFVGDILVGYHLMSTVHYFVQSNSSSCCFKFEYSGYEHTLYYVFRYLLWLNLYFNVKLETNFIEENFSLTYMEKQMRQFIRFNWDSDSPTLKAKNNTCHESPCTQINRKEVNKFSERGLDVVIPTRGVKVEEIHRCVNSIVPSLSEGDTLLIVDDNDSPLKEIQTLKQLSPFIEICIGRGEGVATARNLGIAYGFNRLVLFVDSDDFVLPGFIELQREMHLEYEDICATGTWLRAFGRHKRVYPQWDNLNPLSVVNCLPPAGVLMWKRESLDFLGGFDEFFRTGFEDFDLVSRATVLGMPILVLDIPLYMYQRGHTSLSQTWNWDLEFQLKLRVFSNSMGLCQHKARELFELWMNFGNKVLLMSPAEFDSKMKFDKVRLINKWRNNTVVRAIWYLLPKKVRSLIWRIFY